MEDRLKPEAPRAGWIPLAALGLILLITAGWWALALWPIAVHPGWLARTREVCFGTGLDGLPSAGGWLLLIGEPIGMLAVLSAVWGSELRAGLWRLAGGWWGRFALTGVGITAVAGILAAAETVRAARGEAESFRSLTPDWMAAVDRAAPPLSLINQWGDTVRLSALRGRPVLVTFAFAHCQTICPTQVHGLLAARRAAAARPVALIVTVDPWRDTPSRLPAIAEGWALGGDEYVLSGPVAAVQSTLAEWQVAVVRDSATGNVAHPATVFLVGRDGRLAGIGPGANPGLAAALARM
jgi:cytochrome oxidase Cu insertion factor (SCO1/SenC/PrrC family)